MSHKLFGWAKNRDGKTVCVSDVLKGKDCGCFCPYCNAELIAKKGKVRIHHFAHTKGMECQHGYESSVHLLAKEVLQQTKRLCLPQFALCYKISRGAEKIIIHNSRKENKTACEIHDDELTELMREYGQGESPYYVDKKQRPPTVFDEVLIEQFRGDVKPDAIAIKKKHELLVEFLFSHAIDDVKYEKIVTSNFICVEVDLSKIELKNIREADFDMMEKHLTNSSNIRWIYYPDAIEKIRKELKTKQKQHVEFLRMNNSKKTAIKTNDNLTHNPLPHNQPTKTESTNNKPTYSNLYHSKFDFEYETSCDYILNRVEKGNEDVCNYVKKLRSISGRLQWEDIYSGRRLECRRCPDHRIIGGKVFCNRYTNYIGHTF